jgi:hypothetical protein
MGIGSSPHPTDSLSAFAFIFKYRSHPAKMRGLRSTPTTEGPSPTSIPCYVSELSTVPNKHQPDLLLLIIDLIFSYRELARVEEMALIRSQHVSDVGALITGNLGHRLALSSSRPPPQLFWFMKGHFQKLLFLKFQSYM